MGHGSRGAGSRGDRAHPVSGSCGIVKGSCPFAEVRVQNHTEIVPSQDAVVRDHEGILHASALDPMGSRGDRDGGCGNSQGSR